MAEEFDTISLDKTTAELASILLEYVQELADPRVSRSRFLELAVGLSDEWGKRGGDGIVNDLLNALALSDEAEARVHAEAARRAEDERDGWDGSHHDRHEEKGEGR